MVTKQRKKYRRLVQEDQLAEGELQQLRQLVYLIPVLGFFPALWTLYRGQTNREEKRVSRLAITLALAWLISSLLLQTGSQMSPGGNVAWLLTTALLTSGYFVTNLWLMFQTWRRRL